MIDRGTVAQILDAADIVEVVSDFVHLRRRGANYIGLCPFHNEKTPSFSVSKAKGICKCFSCGKGGSPVNFVMEHEQMSYYEALKYLANKYHIEVKERELTDEERAAQSERESMLIVNDFAANFMESELHGSEDGLNVALSYLYERGFSDLTIKKFRLGYSPSRRDALYQAAKSAGYGEKFLFETGLCVKSNSGSGAVDRFRGRVMFPVLNVAGKVIAFGGRAMKSTDVAKYLNSPESIIYKKSRELYGLYQAKQAIVKKERCFLVEGYTDVISMHQAGIENVVASSGTSLTEGQIRMIHRFTENVTVLYDGDAAGIKASLRGIDLLLAEGLNIKVLLLPDGDDPDSFAKKHNATEFQNYIDENEVDFLTFKTRILMEGIKNDPLKRSAVITDIVKSIAIVPIEINRSIFIQQCSNMLDIDEKVLLREVDKVILALRKKEFEQRSKEDRLESIQNIDVEDVISDIIDETTVTTTIDDNSSEVKLVEDISNKVGYAASKYNKLLYPYEEDIIKYIIRYAMAEPFAGIVEDGECNNVTVLSYIDSELKLDAMQFSNLKFAKLYGCINGIIDDFELALEQKSDAINQVAERMYNEGVENIRAEMKNISDLEHKETILNKNIELYKYDELVRFRCSYLERILCSSENDEIRNLALSLVTDKHVLSKIHTKFSVVESEYDKLATLLPKAIYNWKYAIVECRIKDIYAEIKAIHGSDIEANSLLAELQNMNDIKISLASYLGERVVVPKRIKY
ncbi:MAG: DNA primase [Bacteroidales bacterium]